jgi:hypothetical protein
MVLPIQAPSKDEREGRNATYKPANAENLRHKNKEWKPCQSAGTNNCDVALFHNPWRHGRGTTAPPETLLPITQLRSYIFGRLMRRDIGVKYSTCIADQLLDGRKQKREVKKKRKQLKRGPERVGNDQYCRLPWS